MGQDFVVFSRSTGVASYRADMTPSVKPIRLRLTWSQRRAFVLSVVVFEVLVWSDTLLNEGRFGGDEKTALAGVVFAAMAAATWWVGTSLTRRGLVVHAVPPLVIPWDEVREIEVESSLGISTVVIHHGAATPRRTRLSAPTTGPLGRDEQFQDKVRVLRTFWAAHRDRSRAA
jgi:hypothetical protein